MTFQCSITPGYFKC